MMDRVLALIVDEGKWLTASMGVALFCVLVVVARHRADLPARRVVTAVMNLFFAVTIGVMAFGHLLAVSVKLATGTLQGSVPVVYAIGIVLAVPSWWLVVHTRALLAPDGGPAQKTLVLNAWLAVTLLALGIPNLPLALPALFNIGYQLHSRRFVGWAIVSLATVVQIGLFVGSLIFLASGQSFEQFSGME